VTPLVFGVDLGADGLALLALEGGDGDAAPALGFPLALRDEVVAERGPPARDAPALSFGDCASCARVTRPSWEPSRSTPGSEMPAEPPLAAAAPRHAAAPRVDKAPKFVI